MGTYLSVNEVLEKGKRIYNPGRNQPPVNGWRIVAVCDRIIFKFAVDVTDPEEFSHFYQQYETGALVSMDLYRL